ncbi:hypothetical protein UA08_09263 [Talaromyces atroroseus]|uniref:Zn(2)-C6 fungal-type domain-containing protein n=1 Tax=Talaromyces atroroseus TaxID=1441469 RepID=A0A1Q5Q6H1_TALAT|nr:hypothetical protein UA08_09263 [Talaromyces atroroseus]OKL55446.1 hypothetical protein UA08_09263 [Talaromyces atroroseus]
MQQHVRQGAQKNIRHKRSRTGCLTCRSRGYKCDEARPTCNECRRLGLSCEGYGLRLLWKEDAAKRGIAHGRTSLRTKGKRKHSSPAPESHQAYSNCIPASEAAAGSSLADSKAIPQAPRSLPGVSDQEASLLDHWIKYTSGTLSISWGCRERLLSSIIPLALDRTPLWMSIMAVASSHRDMWMPQKDITTLKWHCKAIGSVKRAILDPALCYADCTLAAILMLHIYEVDVHYCPDYQACISHMKGAASIIKARGKAATYHTTVSSGILISLFCHYDILATPSTQDDPLLSDNWVQVDTQTQMDSFLGFHGPMLRIMAQISHLAVVKRKYQAAPSPPASWEAGLKRQASMIESSILNFQLPTSCHIDSSSNQAASDLVATANAYRYAVLIYLYKSSIRPQRTPSACRVLCQTLSRLLWPLWAAGCEAVQPPDRRLVLQRLENRARKSRNMDQIVSMMQVVWRQKEFRIARNEKRIGCMEILQDTGNLGIVL